jgi:thiosulfate dehydrogenase [quinone] large subunit
MCALADARNFLYCAAAMGEHTRVSYLLPMRLFCGWVLLSAGLSKLSGGWLHGPQLANEVAGWLRDGKPYGFYAPFLRGVVLPNAHTFSYLVSLGELFAGAGLLAGLCSRAAAAGGLLLVGNIMLAQGDGLGANSTAPLVIMMLTMMLTAPGRTLGLDATLRGRIPRWLG